MSSQLQTARLNDRISELLWRLFLLSFFRIILDRVIGMEIAQSDDKRSICRQIDISHGTECNFRFFSLSRTRNRSVNTPAITDRFHPSRLLSTDLINHQRFTRFIEQTERIVSTLGHSLVLLLSFFFLRSGQHTRLDH